VEGGAVAGGGVTLRRHPGAPVVLLLAALGGACTPELPPAPRLTPAPLLSRGRPVASSPPGGAVVVDGVYRTADAWAGGVPTPGRPSWIAIDVGRGPSRILVSWTSSGNHDWLDRKYGAPVDYRIETSADSTDGANGTWRTALTVAGKYPGWRRAISAAKLGWCPGARS
jgi:hypothetical protein